jgi:uncharacterized membrane protein YkvA (DUF1232 family)
MNANTKGILAILMGLLYGVSPIDLIPDLAPLIGVVDDAVLVPALVGLGVWHLARRRRQRPGGPSRPPIG